MNRRTRTAVLGTALLLTAAVAGSTAASASAEHRRETANSASADHRQEAAAPASHDHRREAAALTGTAKLSRSTAEDITFSFDAHLAAKDVDDPLKATGTFEWGHYLHGDGAWARAKVDCLVTGGKVAVVSGVITESDLPGAEGKRVGVTVHDLGRHDRLGYSWASTGSPVETNGLPRCVSSAPFEKVEEGTGDYRVVPWQPEFQSPR